MHMLFTSSRHVRQQLSVPLVAAIVISTLCLAACTGQTGAERGAPQAMPVSVAPAVQRNVIDTEMFSGRIEAAEFVEIRPRVAGSIDTVHFRDGAIVAKGQLLYTIDKRPFEAEVLRASAQLAAARTRSELASSELTRAETLLKSKAISKQEVDQLAAGARTSAADLEAAEAALRLARLNLSYTSVFSPISGRISRSAITAGNLVNDQAVLTTIASNSIVYSYFDISEQTFLRIRSLKGKAPVVRMGLANEEGYPHTGTLDFVDNRINTQTGSIRVRASFDNRQGRFVPGLSARISMETSDPYTATLVPERAIGTDQDRKVVTVVGKDGLPQLRVVRQGTLKNGMRVVLGDAVKPGESVVVEGLQRIMPGVPVKPEVLKVDESGLPISSPAGRGTTPSRSSSEPAQAPEATN